MGADADVGVKKSVETAKMIWRTMRRRPVRMLLTVLQVAIGVWAVTLVLSAAFEVNGRLSQAEARLGHNLLLVKAARQDFDEQGNLVGESGTSLFRLSDLHALADESPNMAHIAVAESGHGVRMESGGQHYQLNGMVFASDAFAQLVGLQFSQGAPFTRQDVDQSSRVVLISETLAAHLFSNTPATGQELSLNVDGLEQTLTVVGVFQTLDVFQELFLSEFIWSGIHAIAPIGLRDQARLSFVRQVSTSTTGEAGMPMPVPGPVSFEREYSHFLLGAEPGRASQAQQDAETFLRLTYGDDAPLLFRRLGEAVMGNQGFGDLLRQIVLFFGAFGAIALGVSAVGIFCIMLVGVVERAHEIGLRRALGATRRAILVQFVVEAVWLTAGGAALGALAAALTGPQVANLVTRSLLGGLLEVHGTLQPGAVIVALVASVVIGGLFALYPALQAARLAPTEAVRER